MIQNDNVVELVGEVREAPKFSHRCFDEDFYQFTLCCKRFSGTDDLIPILISNRTFNVKGIQSGMRLYIQGQIRTYNLHSEDSSKVKLNVFVIDIDETVYPDMNNVYLGGYLCKKPVFRVTPLGREIADVLIATNRQGGKSSYIPLVIWGRNARYVSTWDVGDYISVEGRIQSRTYKKTHKGETEIKTTYEISVVRLATTEVADNA